ncbi:MAG TPA: ABC transporter substrate-binding protein [Paraburkholderia sp.]|jgi:NitT/TauT family transport system substrate-binding protein|nr:ABC transporter substrate-binding protein [Paraburkholderia sp.]
MNDATYSRRSMLAAMGSVGVMAALGFAAPARAQGLTKLVYQTGWLPQPEKGGLYQAAATGLYREHGLDVEIRVGAPQMNVNALFLAGRADFADSDSFRILNFVHQELPGVAVAAFGQKAPNVLLSHPGEAGPSLASLKGKPVLISAIGRQTYWQWLKTRYGFTDEQIRPYTSSMAPFLADPKLSMEGFVTSEPFDLQNAGVKPIVRLLADDGYDAYSAITLASPKQVAEQPDIVQRFVDATAKGWRSYLHGDPRPANDVIKRGNPDMSDAKIAYSIDAMKRYGIVDSGDAQAFGPGAMTDARWKRFYDSMVAAAALPAGLDIRKGYTLQFVNKRVGMG